MWCSLAEVKWTSLKMENKYPKEVVESESSTPALFPVQIHDLRSVSSPQVPVRPGDRVRTRRDLTATQNSCTNVQS